MKAQARLVALFQDLLAGTVEFLVETSMQNRVFKISATHLLYDNGLMQKLNHKDRERVSFWAGIDVVRRRDITIELLKTANAKSCIDFGKRQ